MRLTVLPIIPCRYSVSPSLRSSRPAGYGVFWLSDRCPIPVLLLVALSLVKGLRFASSASRQALDQLTRQARTWHGAYQRICRRATYPVCSSNPIDRIRELD